MLNDPREVICLVRVFIIDERRMTYGALISRVALTVKHAEASIGHSKVN